MPEIAIPVITFGFDGSNQSQYDLRITATFGPKLIKGLVPERRKELIVLLREYADQIESSPWLQPE